MVSILNGSSYKIVLCFYKMLKYICLQRFHMFVANLFSVIKNTAVIIIIVVIVIIIPAAYGGGINM